MPGHLFTIMSQILSSESNWFQVYTYLFYPLRHTPWFLPGARHLEQPRGEGRACQEQARMTRKWRATLTGLWASGASGFQEKFEKHCFNIEFLGISMLAMASNVKKNHCICQTKLVCRPDCTYGLPGGPPNYWLCHYFIIPKRFLLCTKTLGSFLTLYFHLQIHSSLTLTSRPAKVNIMPGIQNFLLVGSCYVWSYSLTYLDKKKN